MNHTDAVAVLRSAHRAGVPPMQFSVLAGLIWHANYKAMCHPGQRTLAKMCSLNKDTVTACLKWLESRHIITIYRKPKAVSHYEIMAKSKWKICPVTSDTLRSHLSGSTAQLPVRPRRTGENAIFRVNCPTTPDVTIGPAVAGNGVASQQEGEEPAAGLSKLAF